MLSACARLLTPDDVVSCIQNRIGARGFVLTFDDGLRDHFDFVASELHKYGLRAFFFINTNAWSGEILDVHRLQLLNASFQIPERTSVFADETRRLGIDCDPTAIPEIEVRRIYRYDNLETARLKFIVNFRFTLEQRQSVVKAMFNRLLGNTGVRASDLYMSADEARKLHEQGHVVGCHTHRHLALSRLSSEERVEDIRNNVIALREAIGVSPQWFSFPFGDERADGVLEACASAGIRFGFTMNRGFITEESTRMRLERVDTNDAPGGKSPTVSFT